MDVNYLVNQDLINPEHERHGKMTYNNSKKHESSFTSVTVQKNHSPCLILT